MDYIKVSFEWDSVEEYQRDLFIGELAEIGFDTFEESSSGVDAFIVQNNFNEHKLNELVESDLPGRPRYQISKVVSENWNEEWERNFTPLIINADCYVRATFHEAQPAYKYEIVIDPKMAFGTGHHQTTTLMMRYILKENFQGKVVLDMGAGTGILGILASKCGAISVTAIDNDDVCFRSAIENATLNGITNLVSVCGSKEEIPDSTFDIILANINRNILLDQISTYSKVLKTGGSIFFSGFYEHPDLDMIKKHAEEYGLVYADHESIGEWVAAKFTKS